MGEFIGFSIGSREQGLGIRDQGSGNRENSVLFRNAKRWKPKTQNLSLSSGATVDKGLGGEFF